MSHNTFRGMAVLALGMTCGMAFGQEADPGAAATAEATVSLGAERASADTGADTSLDAEPTADEKAAALPQSEPPMPNPWIKQLLPVDGMGEMGLSMGLLFPSSRHNFHDESLPHQEIAITPEFAMHGAWFPIRFAGGEVEGGIGASETEDETAAYPWSLRLHAIGQLPLWRVTPFALIGFGRMGNVSNAIGSDGDPLFHFGAGAKLFLTEMLALRFDLRDNLTQRNGSSDGMLTHHVEFLLGASLTLGRPPAPPPAPPPPPPFAEPGPGLGY